VPLSGRAWSGNYDQNWGENKAFQDELRQAQNTYQSDVKKRTTGTYRGGLTTNFDEIKDPHHFNALFDDPDSDVRNASSAYWEAMHPNGGTSTPEKLAAYNMYRGRIMQKNALSEQIAGADDMLNQTQSGLRAGANEAMKSGLKNTEQNFNRRGLLYSGARESGEGQVRGAVASQLASGMVGANRESKNAVQAAKTAYGAIDLAGAQQHIDMANNAFDTAKANNIARLQAMQQLGKGVGEAAGTYFGSRSGGGLIQDPNSSAGNMYDPRIYGGGGI
jgi:uncharacterized phage infection (PIP) family protein YhgE